MDEMNETLVQDRDHAEAAPLLNNLTLINILRDIDLGRGRKPSVHKADFEPGEIARLKQEGKWRKKR